MKPFPPLNAVRAFEVASRHLNLSRAAEELGVTQGAVSKQVIALEDFIGAQLFERQSNGLALTNEGAGLKEGILPAFSILDQAFMRYYRRPPRSSIVRISTLASFASQFLVPRLRVFQQTHPDIELELHTSLRLVDFAREEFDIGVRYGAGVPDNDAILTKLVDGVLHPVCAPSLLEHAGGDLNHLLSDFPMIQHASFNEWIGWSARAGINLSGYRSPFFMEDFVVALRAALVGQGVALLPEILVRDHIAAGELVEFSGVRLPIDYTYHIAHGPGVARRPAVRRVIDWLKAEVHGDEDPSG